MSVTHRITIATVSLLGGSLCLTQAWAARPAAEELAQRDAWVREHFPAKPTGALVPAKPAAPRLMAWTSLGPVFCNTIPGRAMQIADEKFEHGLFCHAPGRVQVYSPGPAKSFSAVVGILTNPDSQGGSVVGCTGNSYPGLKTDAATELQFFETYAKENILPDYWNQDAGWYPCGDGWWNVGTWEVDKTRWPKGLREASDWLHAHRVKRIVWFEPERAAAGTWLTLNHPGWCFGGAGGGLMKIGDPYYRKWITDRVDQLITSEGIDFYRQDFNMDPLYSWRGSDAEDRQGIEEIRHVEGYFAFWDELVRRHPKLWIDSCASGGRGIVHAFRRKTCPDPSITLKLRGLQAETRYRVEDIDGGEAREVQGRELLETGWKVNAASPQTALIFAYRRQP